MAILHIDGVMPIMNIDDGDKIFSVTTTLDIGDSELGEYLVKGRVMSHGIYGGGVQYQFRFPNGLGASVVKHRLSYGAENDLWEVALIKWRGDTFDLMYDENIDPVFDDVADRCTDEQVVELLEKIKNYRR